MTQNSNSGTERATVGTEAEIARLTQEAHDARGSGDRDGAQRLFDERAALLASEAGEEVPSRGEQGTGESGQSDPAPSAPAPLEPEKVDAIFANLADAGVADDALSELKQKWGRDTAANLAHAERFIRRVMDEDPEFASAVDHEAERSPEALLSFTRLAARLGRMSLHDNRPAMQLLRAETQSRNGAAEPMSQSTSRASTGGGSDLAARLRSLTAEAHRAKAEGRNYDADRLFAERSALSRQLGDEPIVGGAVERNY